MNEYVNFKVHNRSELDNLFKQTGKLILLGIKVVWEGVKCILVTDCVSNADNTVHFAVKFELFESSTENVALDKDTSDVLEYFDYSSLPRLFTFLSSNSLKSELKRSVTGVIIEQLK